MRIRLLTLVAALCVIVQVCLAEQFWEKKAYSQWSAKEVAQMMQNSPWTLSYSIGTTNITEIGVGPSGSGRGRGTASQSAGLASSQDIQHQSDPRINYLVQLRSALPIRQAVARKLQIEARYDAMPPQQKAAVDAKIAEYLNTSFEDRVVLQVIYSSNVPTYLSDIRRYWMAQTAEQLKSSMFLNAGGEKIPVEGYVVSADQTIFELTFARPKEVGAHSNLSLEFTQPAIGILPEQKVLVQFKPKDMAVNGAVQF